MQNNNLVTCQKSFVDQLIEMSWNILQVIIFGHSPPGKYERSFQVSKGASTSIDHNSNQWSQHWLQERFNHRYLEFVRKYSKLIVGQFFGHQHSDTFRIFRDEKGEFDELSMSFHTSLAWWLVTLASELQKHFRMK